MGPSTEYAEGPLAEYADGPRDKYAAGTAASDAEGPISNYDWHVTVKLAAPDCFAKDVVLVNGEFQPAIRVRQGDVLQVCTSAVTV